MSKRDIIVLCAIFIFLFLFLGLTGTITSGYHFTDDHEILRIVDDLKNESTINTIAKWVKDDLSIRLRSAYYTHRVIEAKIFQDNILAWTIYTGFIAFLTFAFFYLGMRSLNFSSLESICFLIIVFVGQQMEVWWRLGPSETLGMFLLSISFYFLFKHNLLSKILFPLFLVLPILCKESFITIVPAFLLLKIWYDSQSENISIKESITKNWILVFPIVIVLINIYLILFVIGTNNTGYAGFGDEGLKEILSGVVSNIILLSKEYLILTAILFVILVFIYLQKKDLYINLFKALLFPAIFCLLIVLPNIVLYAKSSIYERYYLPLTLGIAFLIVYIIKEIRFLNRSYGYISVIIILLFFINPSLQVIDYAQQYAEEGKYTNNLLSSINSNRNKDSKILLVADPVDSYEWSFSLQSYLKIKYDVNIYGYPINKTASEFADDNTSSWLSWFENHKLSDLEGSPDMIVFLNKELISYFKNKSIVDIEGYHNICDPRSKFAVLIVK
ncbi:MAG: hypothetical protein AB9846_10640 [Tenuifilaceae bacterium]